MKPLKVEFQAFGPYAGHELVDFEILAEKGLFLICGKTGIGKTMILDAMTFALFGKSSGHGRDSFEAMRCTNAAFDTATFVRFEFENNGEYYCFERRLERKRKNLSASFFVARKDDEGIWQPLMENPKERSLNEKAVEIIGLEYDQFRQVIVLPQGQFEKLLTSNSDEKEKILTCIFGEDCWQGIADRFYAEAEERKNQLKKMQDKIQSSLQEEQCESFAQLEDIIAQREAEEKELERQYQEADYDRVIAEQQAVLSIAKRFGDLHRAEEKVKRLAAEKDDRVLWEKTVQDARRAENVRRLLETVDAAGRMLKKRKQEEEAARAAAEQKKQQAETSAEQLKLHLAKESENEALKARKIQYEEKRNDYKGLDEAEKLLREEKKKVSAAEKEEAEAKKRYENIVSGIAKLQHEYVLLKAEHADLLNGYLAGITGELAAELEAGKPCPVCGSTEHPHKAETAENSITKAMVDQKKEAEDQKYKELQMLSEEGEKAKSVSEEKHNAVETANSRAAAAEVKLEVMKKNLVPGIAALASLEKEIVSLGNAVQEYETRRQQLSEKEKKTKEALAEAKAKIASAEKETADAVAQSTAAEADARKGLQENRFESPEEAKAYLLSEEELSAFSTRIADYDAAVKSADSAWKELKAELAEQEEPDEEKCQELLNGAINAKSEYSGKQAELSAGTRRLRKKLKDLQKEGEGIEEQILEAESDFIFAKKLRGDSGTGFQRYVLGIMFSSVVTAANKMLELVHGGRYRLFRSDEKAQGTNKRGLELKVFDKNSAEHDGRFVSTLSGGEKFLASLALSIGMSTVAQRGGIRIEALFIDEGFGSLDDESIGDAMNVLNSIQEANGLVGIISHVQILQEQIPNKLLVEETADGSHIVQSIG